MTKIVRAMRMAVDDFFEDNCMSMAAALSYYTIFSLPPLLVIVVTIAGYFFGPAAVQGRISREIGDMIGAGAATAVEGMIQSASERIAGGSMAAWLGVAALVFAATTALAQLQQALNRAWEVAPDPDQGGIRNFVKKRILSFGMIVGISFLLLVSLALNTALAAIGDQLRVFLPHGMSAGLLLGIATLLSFLVVTALFGAMFRVLPDAVIGWRDVLPGAVFTSVLFNVGKFFVGFYLGTSDPGSAFGAAGSLAVILVWTYYASAILLLGAEFTQAWVRMDGREIVPEKGAVRVVEEFRRIA